jgi:hypothetical protein
MPCRPRRPVGATVPTPRLANATRGQLTTTDPTLEQADRIGSKLSVALRSAAIALATVTTAAPARAGDAAAVDAATSNLEAAIASSQPRPVRRAIDEAEAALATPIGLIPAETLRRLRIAELTAAEVGLSGQERLDAWRALLRVAPDLDPQALGFVGAAADRGYAVAAELRVGSAARINPPEPRREVRVYVDGVELRRGDRQAPGPHLVQAACPRDGVRSVWSTLEPGPALETLCPGGLGAVVATDEDAEWAELGGPVFGVPSTVATSSPAPAQAAPPAPTPSGPAQARPPTVAPEPSRQRPARPDAAAGHRALTGIVEFGLPVRVAAQLSPPAVPALRATAGVAVYGLRVQSFEAGLGAATATGWGAQARFGWGVGWIDGGPQPTRLAGLELVRRRAAGPSWSGSLGGVIVRFGPLPLLAAPTATVGVSF